jgi:hypothetical protein
MNEDTQNQPGQAMTPEEFKAAFEQWREETYALMQRKLAQGWTTDQFLEALWGKEVMDNHRAAMAVKAQIIKDFIAKGETTPFPKAWKYEQIIYVPSSAGNWLYADLYEASSRALVATWKQPINGKTAQVKQCAYELNTLNWQPIVTQGAQIAHEIIHNFVERAREAVDKAGGSCLVTCPQCSEKYRKMFSGEEG